MRMHTCGHKIPNTSGMVKIIYTGFLAKAPKNHFFGQTGPKALFWPM
jgi:hypothetical protein